MKPLACKRVRRLSRYVGMAHASPARRAVRADASHFSPWLPFPGHPEQLPSLIAVELISHLAVLGGLFHLVVSVFHHVFPFLVSVCQRPPVRRAPGEQLGEIDEADAVSCFEPGLPDPVLLGVVERAQADAPAVGRLERRAAIGSDADMGALDRQPPTARYAAVMPTNPGAMAGASPRR